MLVFGKVRDLIARKRPVTTVSSESIVRVRVGTENSVPDSCSLGLIPSGRVVNFSLTQCENSWTICMDESTDRRWLFARLGLCLVGLVQPAFLMDSVPDDFSKPSWPFFFGLWAATCVGIIFVLGFQKLNPRMDTPWESPSWTRCPFVLKQPLQFFHLGAWYFISIGIGSLIVGLPRTPTNWFWELPLSCGSGVWTGVWILNRLKKKTAPSQ